ncbi:MULTISPECIES: flagellar motor protein MotA [unclassified Chelatococcus]|uniref:flagellar motor protein MotA n=1 Tax=unclassified Chelatococcus TaxID=2638111 RepID=UPI001BCCF838|nr:MULTISPECIES: flagellar motor protein MotA [unclassified Chelatococcus]MBS7696605.1 flagellar motor protein MotA [Chelatococcus sp. YT9]MBX3555170.1 flagellar motor protein MotA [Chelatococcus sp.]
MVADDSLKLTPPRIHVIRMLVFIVLVGFLAFVLHRQITTAFMTNPGLNGLIIGALLIGIVLAFRQVIRLFRSVRWVNELRRSNPNATLDSPPSLLGPTAKLFGNKNSSRGVSTHTFRAILESIGARLDENRENLRYLAGLLVFLGLLGTFWGLLETVSSVGGVISSMRTGAEAGVLFEELKSGLAAPLAGMGISFSSSLFGLAGSLVLGFLDLQLGQAQGRFYTELEDWLSAHVVDNPNPMSGRLPPALGGSDQDVAAALEKLATVINDGQGGRAATHAMANLAEGVQGLVQHMRSEQQMIRDWVEAQASQQRELKRLLERLVDERIR